MYLIFDTETNGKPLKYGRPMNDLANWPRVTQLAFITCDQNHEVIHKYSTLIKPDGWQVPDEPFFKEHNMSTQRCEDEGIPILEALQHFIKQINQCEYLIAHNMEFDYNVVGAEFLRTGAYADRQLKRICTMKQTTSLLQLPGKYGFKYPKLEELHQYLFGHDFPGAHDALYDVMATARCFFELVKQNAIQYERNN